MGFKNVAFPAASGSSIFLANKLTVAYQRASAYRHSFFEVNHTFQGNIPECSYTY